jgi:synaptobrevin family protein YKT6
MQFTSGVLADRAQVPSHQTITEQEYRLRCYVRPDSLTGVCVTDQEYEDRVSFTMLAKILDEFALAVPAHLWPTLDEKSCNFNRLPELLIKWQNPREADALMRVQVRILFRI